MQIELDNQRLEIAGKAGILYGGEFQYFRIPPELWESSIQLLAEAHINFVSCYIPWIFHEYEPGVFDFTGQSRAGRNLQRLFELIESHDLAILARPGPYVYGEYQGFGIPEWLRESHPEILMIYETKSASREVALNHPVYLQYAQQWLNGVFDFLQPWVDSGRIVGCQIDNETGLPQFGGVEHIGDFNPHTVGLWQAHLASRYRQIAHLNHVWKHTYASFDQVPPPSQGQSEDMHYRHWAVFIEDYLVDHLRSLHQLTAARFPDLFLYTNDPYLNQWPNHSPKKAKLMTVGFDIYSKFTTDRISTHDVPFSLSLAPEFYASINPDRLLMGVEVGAGWFDPRVKVSKEATLQKSMLALLRGTRVLDYYLLHDCIEDDGVPWIFQSPLDKDGKTIDRYATVQAVGAFCKDHGHLLADSEPLHNAIGVLKYIPQNWDFLRYNYTLFSALDLMDSALIHFSGLSGVYGGLLEAGYNPIVHDLETIPMDLLQQLKVVFLASTSMMDRESYQKLLYYVEQGGTLISFGFPPQQDAHGAPYTENPLFPARATGSPHRIQYGNATLPQMVLDMMNYQMLKFNHPHRLSLHTLDMMHPFVELTKYLGKTGIWLETDRGQPFWASRFVSFWQGGGVRPLLTHPTQGMVAYTRRVGAGRIVFMGSAPGLFFDTPAYYTIEAEKKQSVLNGLSYLLRERGLSPLVEPIPNTEVILRQSKDGMLVALINRGPDQAISLQFNYAFRFNQIEILFNQHAERDFLEPARFQQMRGHLSKDAVLVALLRH